MIQEIQYYAIYAKADLHVINCYRAFSCDVMSAILVYLNNEKSAILVYQISPVGVELFCNAKTFFCFIKQIWPLIT